jgi:excisionase family DNA binding protein
MDEIRWRGTKQAAAYLGVTPRTLYRLIDHGDIPAYHMGRVFRLKQDDLDAFVERVRVAPGSLRHLYPHENGLAGSRRPGKPAHDGAPIAEEEER